MTEKYILSTDAQRLHQDMMAIRSMDCYPEKELGEMYNIAWDKFWDKVSQEYPLLKDKELEYNADTNTIRVN